MNLKAWLVIVCFFIWSIGSGWYYTCKIKQVCPGSALHSIDSLAIGFEYNNPQPFVSSHVSSFIDSLNSKSSGNNVLEVVGMYDTREQSNKAIDIGVERAELFLDVYRDSFTYDEVRVSSETMNLDSIVNYFSALEFRLYTKNEKLEEGNDRAILYIDDGDFSRLSPKIDAYLTYLSIEQNDAVVDLVGHCYSQDSAVLNYNCGLDYVNLIRSKMIDKGFNEYQVTAISQGDEMLLNNTDSVSRVEVIINN